MTDTVAFSDIQLQKILTTLEAMKSVGIHREQVIPVFLSAALGMSVGVELEYFKSFRERSDPHFFEHDFLDRLPFIVEKDPQLLKQSFT